MHCRLGGCTIATVDLIEVEVVEQSEEAEAEGGGEVQLAEMEVVPLDPLWRRVW